MKKTYIAPTAKEININTQAILTGSTLEINTGDTTTGMEAKENLFFDEF